MNMIKTVSISLVSSALIFGSISSARCADGGDQTTTNSEESATASTEKTESPESTQPESKTGSQPVNNEPKMPQLIESDSVQTSSEKDTQQVSKEPKAEIKPWIKSHKVSRKTRKKGQTINVFYPQFAGEPKETVAKLNQLMKKLVNRNMPTYVETQEGDPDYLYECDYHENLVSPNLVSVDVNFYSFTGGAHGNGYTVPFNYLLTDKGPREITIKNLFGKKPNVKTLQTLIRPRLQKTLYPEQVALDSWIVSGTEKLKDFDCITLSRKGITFNFQSYQVACYAAGTPSVRFSYRELSRMFDTSSPLYDYVQTAKNNIGRRNTVRTKAKNLISKSQ